MNTAVQKEVDDQVIEDQPDDKEIERALFNQAIADDPEISTEDKDRLAEVPVGDVEPALPVATQPAAEKPVPEPAPTGFEFLDEIPEGPRQKVQAIIQRQEQEKAQLRQRVSSHLGQLQPAQRMISQLHQQKRVLEEKIHALQPTELSTGVNVKAQIAAFNAQIDKGYKDFPEEAAQLKTLFAESLDGALRSIPAPQRQELPPAEVGPDPASEVQHLATAYSDWGERRFSPEFHAWLVSQPQNVKQQLNSPYAADNIALLDMFTHDNPDWAPPQTADEFHTIFQAQFSPLFRGWADAEGINPNSNFHQVPDHQRDMMFSQFKNDLRSVYAEMEQAPDPTAEKLATRRAKQLQDRAPGSRRTGVKPGQTLDLETKEGQRAYFDQLVASDPDLR